MLKNQMNGFTAAKLRIILLSTILLLIVISTVGFWVFRSLLVDSSVNVQSAKAVAASSTIDVAKLKKIKIYLSNNVVAVTRAKSIVADSQTYKYQDQIISDINTYAKTAGVSINGFTFNNTTGTTDRAATSAVAPGSPATPAGLKSVSVSVDIKSPVNYQAIMRFIHALELNLTKLQLSGISLQKSIADPSQVTVNPLTIEVYTR